MQIPPRRRALPAGQRAGRGGKAPPAPAPRAATRGVRGQRRRRHLGSGGRPCCPSGGLEVRVLPRVWLRRCCSAGPGRAGKGSEAASPPPPLLPPPCATIGRGRGGVGMAVSARRSRRPLRLCGVGAALRELFVCEGEKWALHRGEGRDGAADVPS